MSKRIYLVNKICCVNCKSEIKISNFEKHINGVSCKKGGTFQNLIKARISELTDTCKFCGILNQNKHSLIQHQLRCAKNPNKIKQTVSSALYGMRGKTHSEETKRLIGLKSKGRKKSESEIQKSKEARLKYWTPETRAKHSELMKQIVVNNPTSYYAGNQGRSKTYEIDNIKLKGKWEVKFYLWCKEHNIQIERPSTGFEYIWEGTRLYFPDFFLSDYNLYVEIKGYETDRDKAKWSYFPHKLAVVRKSEINQIENNTFLIENIL